MEKGVRDGSEDRCWISNRQQMASFVFFIFFMPAFLSAHIRNLKCVGGGERY